MAISTFLSIATLNVNGLNAPIKRHRVGAGPVAEWLSSCALLQWPGVHGFGSWMWTCTLLIKLHCGGIPQTKQRKSGMDVSSGDNLPQAKRGGLATDVSSGPIFLTKKRNKTKIEGKGWPFE